MSNYILQHGTVKALDGSDDKMELSGWLSTGDTDLADEIVEPMSAKKYLKEYEKAGRLWFNHDSNLVLGRVHSMHLEEQGMHIDMARLSQTPFNKEFIWPHIKEGALSEFSIQFQSRKGKFIDKIYHHQEIYIIESSIVSVACNPSAVIDGFKSLITLDDWKANDSIEKLAALYESGRLKLPSEVRTAFAVDGFRDTEEVSDKTNMNAKLGIDNGEPLVPDFADIKVIALSVEQKSLLDPTGEAKALPKKEQKNYTELCDCLYLAKSESRDSYMFRIGVPTDEGFKYDWDSVALSMCNILGARGPAHFVPEEKVKAINTLCAVYKLLKKELPEWKGVSLKDVDETLVEGIKFNEVEFKSGEKEALEKTIFEKSLEAASNYLKSLNEDDLALARKSVYGSFNVCFSVYPDGSEDFTFLDSLIAAYNDFCAAEMASEMSDMTSDYVMRGFAEHLLMSSTVAEESEEEAIEEEINEDVIVPESALAEALKEYLANK